MSGRLTDEGATYWLAMDGWTADEAAYLLHAIDPRYGRASIVRVGGRACVIQSDPMMLSEFSEMIARAFEAGALRSPSAPGEVIAWAKSKGLRLPRQFLDVQCGGTRQAVPVIGEVGETPQERRAAAAIRARGIKRDILENWDDIARQYGPDADAAQVARFFSLRRDPSYTKRERKTYHNRLGELRAAGLIP